MFGDEEGADDYFEGELASAGGLQSVGVMLFWLYAVRFASSQACNCEVNHPTRPGVRRQGFGKLPALAWRIADAGDRGIPMRRKAPRSDLRTNGSRVMGVLLR
jgi:hypothetical protein